MTGPGHRLFAYGTLLDPQIRRRVLGAELGATGARLPGYGLREADGYYFARRELGESIRGAVLVLSDEQLARADAWEEVPVYRRVRVSVALDAGDQVDAWVYVREDVEGARVERPGIAAISREGILAGLDADP